MLVSSHLSLPLPLPTATGLCVLFLFFFYNPCLIPPGFLFFLFLNLSPSHGFNLDSRPDGTEDVNDFLLRIRELGEKRDKEDDHRTKKLEDEILQGRKERQARRAGNDSFISLSFPTFLCPFLLPFCLCLSASPPQGMTPTTNSSPSIIQILILIY